MLGQLQITSGAIAIGAMAFGLDLIDDGPGVLLGLSAIVWKSPARTTYITSPIREGGAMAALGIIDKQPRELVDLQIDYSKVLAGRVADSVTPTVEVPAGMALAGTDIGASSVRLYVSGGVSGQVYRWTVLTDIVIGLRTIRVEDEFVCAVQEAS